ncbi:hypothetical protein Q3G72_000106 [Acer saccharum]|nr:hypothetical protein Q3G72_000106 [Acer saccharum]
MRTRTSRNPSPTIPDNSDPGIEVVDTAGNQIPNHVGCFDGYGASNPCPFSLNLSFSKLSSVKTTTSSAKVDTNSRVKVTKANQSAVTRRQLVDKDDSAGEKKRRGTDSKKRER